MQIEREALPVAPGTEFLLPSGKQTNRLRESELEVSNEAPRAFAQKHPRAKGFQRKVRFFKQSPAASALRTRHLKPVTWASVTNDDKSIVPLQCEHANGKPRLQELARAGLLDHYNAWMAGKTEVTPTGTPLAVLALGKSVEDWLKQRGFENVEHLAEAKPRELVEIMGPDEGPQLMQLAREWLAEKQTSEMNLGQTPKEVVAELQAMRKENAEMKTLLRQVIGRSDPKEAPAGQSIEELADADPEPAPTKRKQSTKKIKAV